MARVMNCSSGGGVKKSVSRNLANGSFTLSDPLKEGLWERDEEEEVGDGRVRGVRSGGKDWSGMLLGKEA
jgi:hypothetical protein